MYTRCASLSTKGGKDTLDNNCKVLFNKYEVIDTIGNGGTGTVFLVRHMALGVKRAIKSIKKNFISSESFFYEANILKNLKHPGIPIIYDIEEEDDNFYIVEEYIEGVSLEHYLKEYPKLSTQSKVQLVKKLCDIVWYLHNQRPYPIIHLDIKPQNILVSKGRVYLIDYGNGYIMNTANMRNYYHGTYGYASPEQYVGEPIGTESDVYSLAKVIKFVLGSVIDDEFLHILNECMSSNTSDRKINVGDIINYLNKKYKNNNDVSRNIYIMATQKGLGATHLSLALVSALNDIGISSVYIDNEMGCTVDILDEHKFNIDNDGVAHICDGSCRLLPSYDIDEMDENRTNYLKIVDEGVVSPQKIIDGRNIILLCGGRAWEKDNTFQMRKQIDGLKEKNIFTVYNFGNGIVVPYIKNPLKLTWFEKYKMRKIIVFIRKWERERNV